MVAEHAHDTVFGMQLAEYVRERQRFFYAKADKVTREANKVGLLGVDSVDNT